MRAGSGSDSGHVSAGNGGLETTICNYLCVPTCWERQLGFKIAPFLSEQTLLFLPNTAMALK